MASTNPPPASSSPQPTPPQKADPALARYKRRSRLGLLLKIIAVFIIIILGLVIYLQSAHAMIHFYLPFASKTLGTQISATGGSVKFNGRLHLDGLTVMGSDNQPAFQADMVDAKVRPMSLLGDDIPSIDLAKLLNAVITYRDLPGGSNNWSFLPQGPDNKKKSDTFPQIRIDNVSIVGFRADYVDATGLTVNLNKLDLNAQNLAPGSTGQFQLGIDARVQRAEPPLDQTAVVGLKGELTQDSSGKELAYNGTTEASFKGEGSSAERIPPMDLTGKFDGKLNNKGAIQQNADFSAKTPQGSAGDFTTQVNWDPTGNAREAHLTVKGVSREFLNPIISTFLPLQLNGAAIDAKADVTGNADKVTFTSEFNAGDLSFRVIGRKEPTPPVTVKFAQNGAMDLKQEILDLQAMALAMTGNGNRMIDLALDKPIQLNLKSGGTDSALGNASVKLKINALTVATIQPWLAIAGINDVGDLKSGSFDGDCVVAIERQGENIAVVGKFQGTGVKYGAFDPVDFNKDIDIAIANLDDLKIQKAVVALNSGGQKLADITAGGDLSIKKQTGNLTIQLSVPKVLASARKLGFLDEPPAGLSDGTFVANQKIALGGQGGPIDLTGDARMEGVTLSVRGSEAVPLGLRVANNLNLDQRSGRVKISQFRAEFDNPGGKEAGTAELKGEWPLSLQGNEEGSIDATVRKVDLAPWLKLTRTLSAEQIPPIPFEMDEKIRRQADGKLAFSGDVRVGVPIPAQQGQAAQDLNLAIHNELTQWGNKLEGLIIEFAGKGAGSDDKVRVEGAGTLGEINVFSLKADVTSLNAGKYMAAMNALNPPPAQPTPTPEPSTPAPPPLKVDAQWTIKEATMNTTKITDAAGTLNFDRGAIDFKMPGGKIAGGTLVANFSGNTARAEPQYTWKANLDGAPIADLVGMVDPKNAQKVTGIVSMQTEGTGEGKTVEALQRKLDSKTHFLIKDGELKNIPWLEKLSEMTNSDTFKNVKFFKFDGNINFTPGQGGKIEQTAMVGPVNKIGFSGDVGLDATYKVRVDPAINSQYATSEKLKMYAALATDAEGFVHLPVALVIQGKGAQYAMNPVVGLPIGGGAAGGKPDLDQALRGVLGGVVEQKQNKDGKSARSTTETTTAPTPRPDLKDVLGGLVDQKLGGKQTEQAKPAQTAPTQLTTTSGTATAEPTPRPEKTPKPSTEQRLLDALGSALQK